jgi:TatD DNase family protein
MEHSTTPLINIHTHTIPNSDEITILNVFPNENIGVWLPANLYFSTGIHPWHLGQWKSLEERLTNLACNPRVIAVGECGLDTQASSPMEQQEEVFCQHIALSEEYKKPLIIHCVKAFNELIGIHKKMKPKMPWIIHGFNASAEIAKKCLDMGMMLSFGMFLLNEKSKATNIAKDIPTSVVFLETDESKTTISDIYNRFSAIKSIPMETLKAEIAKNFNNCFKSCSF